DTRKDGLQLSDVFRLKQVGDEDGRGRGRLHCQRTSINTHHDSSADPAQSSAAAVPARRASAMAWRVPSASCQHIWNEPIRQSYRGMGRREIPSRAMPATTEPGTRLSMLRV